MLSLSSNSQNGAVFIGSSGRPSVAQCGLGWAVSERGTSQLLCCGSAVSGQSSARVESGGRAGAGQWTDMLPGSAA